MTNELLPSDPPLKWTQQDIERRLFFPGGRYTRVNDILSFLLGAAATVAFYAALLPLEDTHLAQMFTERGPVPYFIALLSWWAIAILFIKWRKLCLQRRALRYTITPEEHDFVLSSGTVDQVVANIYQIVDEPRHFVLFNRISVALSNLKNLGRVSDVDDILRAQSDNDYSSMETSYSMVSGFVWAIPVLGFIGTVLGLSEAIGQFGSVLSSGDDMSLLAESLRGVTGGLAIAFETTLEGLVAALAVQLILTVVRKQEEEFLDECSEYCVRNIVGRLRVMPFVTEAEE